MKKNPLHTFFGDAIIRFGQFFDDGSERCRPHVHETAYIAPHAVLIGDVRIGARVFVAPNATLRADLGSPFFVGEETNLQDNTVFHADDETFEREGKSYAIFIGRRVTISHQAMVQGPARIEDHAYVGIGAKVLTANLGEGCYVSHGAIVHHVTLPPGTFVPKNAVVDSQLDARKLGPVNENRVRRRREIVAFYLRLGKLYRNMSAASPEDQ